MQVSWRGLGLVLAVLAGASCVIQDPRFGAQPSAPPAPRAAPVQPQPDAGREAAETYDQVFAALDEGDRDAKSGQYDAAAQRYETANGFASQLIASLAGRQAAAGVTYPTAHDGKLDRATLVSNLEQARDRSRRAAERAKDQAFEQLADEIGASTPGQRAVLRQHGRPEITKSRREMCWLFHNADSDETYCWQLEGGKLAKHQSVKRAAVTVASAPADPPPPAEQAAPAAPAASSGSWPFWRASSDCRAIIDKASYECESADCRAIVDNASYECASADCRAIVDNASYECAGANCRAIIDKASYECESADCRAIVDKASYECETANCRAVVDHANYECN